jgi:predicted DNA-binding transcriptional regulator AlpA
MTTRRDRFIDCLSQAEFTERGISPNELANELLAIADARTLLTVGDVARLTGRKVSTLFSWIEREQNGIPSSVLGNRTHGRPLLFDQDEITAWIETHPELIRKDDAL